MRLKEYGFTKREISDFDKAPTEINTDSPVWEEILKHRRRIMKRASYLYELENDEELTREQLDRWVDGLAINPWEWVKLEYKYSRDRVSDFTAAMHHAREKALKATRTMRRGWYRG